MKGILEIEMLMFGTVGGGGSRKKRTKTSRERGELSGQNVRILKDSNDV